MPRRATTPSLTWDDGAILTVDQRYLPHEHRTLRLTTVHQLVDAIKTLAIRGAPAIGLAGALGVALSAYRHHTADGLDEAAVRADAERIAAARPTAVNLSWAVRHVLTRLPEGPRALLAEATALLAQDVAAGRAAVTRAADLVESLTPDRPLRVLTHCNTGRLATAATGTALGAILELADRGRIAEVLVDETRPLLQGARLTAWELGEAEVPYRLCVDSAAPAAMAGGLVDCVLVGADRIAANGDVANKIGTYALAVAAARHRIPFVVVAPESTWDRELADGTGIVVEERDPAEVTSVLGTPVAPAGARVHNPAFDVTPGDLVTAIVSEHAVVRPYATRGRLATELAAFSRELYQRGWMPGTSGNLSVRLPGSDGLALITASGRDKGSLTAADVVAVRVATDEVAEETALRASAETAIHTAVYRATGAAAVIHVHAPYATAVARRHGGRSLVTTVELARFELLKGLGLADPSRTALPVFPNWPDVTRIARDVAAHLADHPQGPPALLLTDHGVTVWGATLAEARNRLECLEAICHQLALDAAGPGVTG
ncbi:MULTISPECIES: bifunctional S-methyl-5-thioribose-1-phosphate isomerase/methylthioribulose 1-phosphate dehydratase [Streptomycetaceae]|uniref:Methylthioribose-1-phosphate isomerase n=1 Tax=Streptantibioticus cattleyicolor (strain ATCC 35852 / DSM 46488 / JCM 4925 / NBRC 14057 / NRRL 8057) TaxID=1003195 RepID=F8K2V4_STREN|nr:MULTISPECIES: bifunctional S-methyl-5-thioribose-1-phosphate isomerase/methylthioribulose 1-phosphate dehydratase [Streptomycetaceae]AEW95630.1 putative initiation factor eIF-2B alpha subunit-like protein [Streptantibioticus cattleyicolor NRRL 8057 = DSM 46488]MYS60175.1 bifunctional S-methyl-5-thioribose-1-phosphate isomerase/methylthioribulose 1-phosphate dehydratase [Streptomyces sp. SID5468]CCB75965.1 Methylthioribose-1-phosphate isomerase [Streptantibioticus cattleyicolor NRRL 8057 = DSM